ncbi:MAG: rhodanese-like domain-containing protein [Candidatus Eremiobacterota bacterium]
MRFRALSLLVLALWVVACNGDVTGAGPVSPAVPPPSNLLVQRADFAQEVRVNQALIVLAAESRLENAPVTVFSGARYVNVDDVAAFSLEAGAFFDLAGWSQRFGQLGLTPSSDVVVYDDGELKFASRIRFLLLHFGVARARILVEGFRAAEQVDMRHLAPLVPTRFEARILNAPIPVVFRPDVAALLGDPLVQIVDVRTPAEFNGQLLLPGDARPGHIPGAVNVDENRIFNQGVLRSTQELRALFESAGLSPARRTVVYCHDGAKSSLIASFLVELGWSDVSLYYDSYQDWSKDLSLPVEL